MRATASFSMRAALSKRGRTGTLHHYLTLANRVVQSFPKITTSECPENGFMPVSSPSVYCKNLRSGKHPSSPEDFKKSAAPTGTFRKPKRCKWHHPWENPRLHQWQSSYMQVNGFITGNPFEKPFCWYQILNCSLFWMTVSKNLKSQMGAAGGDDQLFKPNGVENADLAPTRAFAKYQGSGDLFGGWYSNESISHLSAGKTIDSSQVPTVWY